MDGSADTGGGINPGGSVNLVERILWEMGDLHFEDEVIS